jgi:3-oxoacyl-[acyl-carrier-protein] synthase-3
MAVPERVVDNAAIAARTGVTADWIVKRTGVRERHIADPEERVADLAAAAGRLALERAGVDGAELDLVLVATMAADQLTPNAAPLVACQLGAERAGGVDLGAACTGFLSGLAMAAGQVESGRCERALLIGVDLLSRLTDTSDRGTAALFADGAGAVVVGPAGGRGSIGPVLLRADGDGAELIQASHHERKIRMQGHDTYREAVRRLSEATVEAAERAGLALGEIDLFVYHQANVRVLSAVGKRLGLPPCRVLDCIDRYGNTSSATIPIALAEAQATGALEPGMSVLVGAFGAGFTWGAGVIEWS